MIRHFVFAAFILMACAPADDEPELRSAEVLPETAGVQQQTQGIVECIPSVSRPDSSFDIIAAQDTVLRTNYAEIDLPGGTYAQNRTITVRAGPGKQHGVHITPRPGSSLQVRLKLGLCEDGSADEYSFQTKNGKNTVQKVSVAGSAWAQGMVDPTDLEPIADRTSTERSANEADSIQVRSGFVVLSN